MEIDWEILGSPAFIILAGFALVATALGYMFGKQSGMPVFPLWQLFGIMAGEVVAAYIFASRG